MTFHCCLLLDCSSSTHTWDAFQLAQASFRIYCVQNNHVLPANSHKVIGEQGPCLLGDRLKINVDPPEMDVEGDDESSLGTLPAIRIHDDDVSLRILVCGVHCTLVSWDGSLFTGPRCCFFAYKHMDAIVNLDKHSHPPTYIYFVDSLLMS
jgi:hypothetical protein